MGKILFALVIALIVPSSTSFGENDGEAIPHSGKQRVFEKIKGWVHFRPIYAQIANLEAGIKGRCEESVKKIVIIFFSPSITVKFPKKAIIYYFVFNTNEDMELFQKPNMLVRVIGWDEIEFIYLRDAI